MTSPAVTVSPDVGVGRAARLMERHGVGQLPVVDDSEHLLGVISRRGLLSVFLRDDRAIAEEIRQVTAHVPRSAGHPEPTVVVEDGMVRLTGTLEHHSDVQTVVRHVTCVDGVVAVDPDLGWRVDDVLPEYMRWGIGVS